MTEVKDLYWLDTGWACGGVLVDNLGKIVGGAPIFKKLLGQQLIEVLTRGRYKYAYVGKREGLDDEEALLVPQLQPPQGIHWSRTHQGHRMGSQRQFVDRLETDREGRSVQGEAMRRPSVWFIKQKRKESWVPFAHFPTRLKARGLARAWNSGTWPGMQGKFRVRAWVRRAR